MGFPYPGFIKKYQLDKLRARTRPGPNGCLEWTGPISTGYPSMSLHGRTVGAHRVAYVGHYKREIPDGYEIDHLCGNRICVNPDHLDVVTRSENLRRMWVKRGQPDRPPVGDKTCRHCGHVGTRSFVWDGEHWHCKNTVSCQKRIDAKHRTPNWMRCERCKHKKVRHNPHSPDQMSSARFQVHCYVTNCKCGGWSPGGIYS